MQCLVRDLPALGLHGATQQLEIDLQERHLLADVVVQLTGNPRALGFLRIQQPGAEVADSLVAGEELCFM